MESATSTTPATDSPAALKSPTNTRLGDQVFGSPTTTPHSDFAKNAQQARLVGRISRAFQSAQIRGGPLRIRLHPSELGSLSIELQLENGALNAKLEVENQAARTVILDNLPNLRDRLSEQGVRVEQFDVELTGQGDGRPADLAEQHQSGQRETEEAPAGDASSESNGESSEAGPSLPTPDGGLNVIV